MHHEEQHEEKEVCRLLSETRNLKPETCSSLRALRFFVVLFS
jgi:hypothetical protein